MYGSGIEIVDHFPKREHNGINWKRRFLNCIQICVQRGILWEGSDPPSKHQQVLGLISSSKKGEGILNGSAGFVHRRHKSSRLETYSTVVSIHG